MNLKEAEEVILHPYRWGQTYLDHAKGFLEGHKEGYEAGVRDAIKKSIREMEETETVKSYSDKILKLLDAENKC